MWFVVFALSVWLGMHVHVGWSVLRHTDKRRLWWVVGAMVTSIGIAPLTFLMLPRSGEAIPDLIQIVGYTVMGVFSVVWAFLLVKDVVWLIARGVSLVVDTPLSDPSRRDFFGRVVNGVTLGAAGVVSAAGVVGAQQAAEVVRTTVVVPGLDPRLEGFTIAQVSDIHVGPTVRRELVEDIVDAVNALNADLVAVTGDLVDGSVERLAEHVEPLRRLRGRHGVFFCTGNHEYYSGVHPWLEKVRELGMVTLVEEHVVIEHEGANVVVAGVSDYAAKRMEPTHISDPTAAFAGAPEGFRLLLAHQPRSYIAALSAGAQLMLSGHTHAGQYFPFTWVVRMAQPFVEGLTDHEGMWVYVNRGTTWWGPPMRLGAPQEISLLELRGGEF